MGCTKIRALLHTNLSRLISEVEYIIRDCEAKLIITSNALKHVVIELTGPINDISERYIIDGQIDGWNSLEEKPKFNAHISNRR